MSKKSHRFFNSQRLNHPSARKRVDALIVIAGLIVALAFGVLTWFNYQDRNARTGAQLSADIRTT